ncbi:MAG TPA: VOC family protein [Nitrolancea sp.]|nr:VOC family protein [Nitrolancea sp.]
MDERIRGMHHVTAIAGEPQPNVDFYSGVLGLRLVKRTVNFDDPSSYHLYYGDADGNPGTILTFFAWPGARGGRQGAGQAIAIALAIPRAALGFWMQRLIEHGITFNGPQRRFDEQVLLLRDPHGLPIELIAQADPPMVSHWEDSGIPEEHGIRGVHSATLWVTDPDTSNTLLANTLGLQKIGAEAGRERYTTADTSVPGHLLDVQSAAGFWPGEIAVGTVHHLAWRTGNDETQAHWRTRIDEVGLSVTPSLDRNYFHSIYFREPGGVLFEIATDSPGFQIDEPPDALGSRLMLPSWLESKRDEIEAHLPPIRPAGRPPFTRDAEPPEPEFIHRFVAAERAQRAPTLLLLHGTGGNETDLLPLGHALAPMANLLSPRGRVSERGLPRFFRRLAEGVFDHEDLVEQTHALARFVAAATERYGLDPRRIIAVGYSNGANIAGSLLLLHPEVLAGAVLFRPMVPLEPSLAPDLTDIPILIAASREDQLIDAAETERLAALLEGFGAEVTLTWQRGGHGLTNADLDTAQRWLAAQPLTLPDLAPPETTTTDDQA